VPEESDLEVGRDPNVGLVLFDQTVSRHHARVRHEGGALLIEDLGSRFGTFVNDRPIREGEAVALRDGDIIRLGQVRMVCRFDAPGLDLATQVEDAAFAAQANARLILLEGDEARRRPIAGPSTLIGSAPHCEVRLKDRAAPAQAALLRATNGKFCLEPRSAATPPRLNETQEPVHTAIELPSSSVVAVRESQLLFLYDFERGGLPVTDPLAALNRKWLLREVEALSGTALRELLRVTADQKRLGQRLGEILVERKIVTPLFWRVIRAKLLHGAASRGTWSRWLPGRRPS